MLTLSAMPADADMQARASTSTAQGVPDDGVGDEPMELASGDAMDSADSEKQRPGELKGVQTFAQVANNQVALASEDSPIIVTSSPSEWVFSPNGDDYEDAQSLTWGLSEPATVTALVQNSAGTTVRSLLVDQSVGTYVNVSWNGLDDFGVLATDGIYTVKFTARDAQGDTAEKITRTGIRQQIPGTWTAPANGSTVSGTIDLVATPTPGVNVTNVRFQLPGSGCCYSAFAAGDGTWRYTMDTNQVSSGTYPSYAYLYWTDELGAGHAGYQTPTANLTIDNPVRITSSPSEWVFSPNGDDYEDAQSLTWGLSEPATVTALVQNSAGTTVRSLLVDQSVGTYVNVSWNGLDDFGVLATDGIYTVKFTARDAQGDTAEKITRTGIRQQIPGTWTAPANGSTVSGTIDLVATPTPGVNVTNVRFQLPGSGCCYSAFAAGDGTWRYTMDTNQVSSGTYPSYAYLYWTDELGAGHAGYQTPTANLTIDNPVRITSSPSEWVFSPNGDDYEDAQSLTWGLSEPATVTALVQNSAGTTVRSLLVDQSVGTYVNVSWNGLDDFGVLATDGIYTVKFTARDAQGDTAEKITRTGIRQQIPGTWTAPANGSTVSGTIDLVATPTPGVNVTNVRFQLPGSGCCYSAFAAGDGTWRYTMDTNQVSSGTYPSYAYLYWTDELGAGHAGYQTPTANLTIDNPVRITSSPSEWVFSPNGDDYEDAQSLTWGLSEPATVTALVQNSAGTTVRSLLVDQSVGTYVNVSWNGLDDFGVLATDGIYTVKFTARDAQGDTAEKITRTGIRQQIPGTWTAPANGSTVSGTIDLVATPTPGVNVTNVRFQLPGSGCCYSAFAAGDGTWRYTMDTNQVSSGTYPSYAYLYWTDELGAGHAGYQTPTANLTIDNPVRITSSPSEWVFSPNGDDYEDAQSLTWGLSEPATVTALVQNSAGTTVRSLLVDQSVGTYVNVSWNGLDDFGVLATDGIYTVKFTARDAQGDTAEKITRTGIRQQIPGTWTAPANGSTVSGTIDLVATPTPGVNVTNVRFQLPGSGCCYSAFAAGDGTWRYTMDTNQVSSGTYPSYAYLYWTDELGAGHAGYQTPTANLTIDNTAPSAALEAAPASGPAPLVTQLVVDAFDPSDRPVSYSVTFGDGSAAETGKSFAPYDTITIGHTYATPGSYTAHLVVADTAGNEATSTTQIEVSPAAVNDPPTIDLVVDQISGVAPFLTSARIDANDQNNDTLSYSVDFGDGSSPVTAVTAGVPLTHTYATPGRYVIRASVSDGLETRTAIQRITVALPEPLAAAAGDDRVVTAGDEVSFDAGASRPQGLGIDFDWEFGDGTFGTGATADHVFAQPGHYQVVLTAKLGDSTATDTASVTVLPVPVEPGLNITIRSGGSLLGGAEVTAILAGGERITGVTDATGSVRLNGLPDGDTTVYVWANGYRPTAVTAQLKDGAGAIDVNLESGQIATSQIESTRLTAQEIVDAGIDVTDPANVSVYKFEIHLNIDGFDGAFSGYSCSSECSSGSGGGGGGGGGWITYEGVPCQGTCIVTTTTGGRVDVSVQWVPGAGPVGQYLIIPGEARFLKEFFDVSLVVQNLTSAPFAFEDGSASLGIPAGLTLAPTATRQQVEQPVENIPAGESRTTQWVLRGDTEGEYNLSATYTGTVAPIGRPIRLEALSTAPLKVWGASALTMLVDADAQAYSGYPYNVRVGLKNVSDHPVYNAAVELKTEGAKNYIYQPRERLTQSVAGISPGDTFWTEYLLVPTISGTLDLSESFVLHTGGDVDLPDVLVSHPPVQTPDTAPKARTYGYKSRVVFDWDAVAGAEAYQIYRTPAADVQFGANPVPLTYLSGSSTRASTPLSTGDDPFWAISPAVSGAPFMRHPLFKATANQEYPKVNVTRDCLSDRHKVHLEFIDPIFDPASVTITRDGTSFPVPGTDALTVSADQSGFNRSTIDFEVAKAGLDLQGDKFAVTLQNSEGDISRTSTFALRSVCVRYAALGDSFSAGEGAGDGAFFSDGNFDYDWRTVEPRNYVPLEVDRLLLRGQTVPSTTNNSCHRSSHAYGPRILKEFGEDYKSDSKNPTDAFLFTACSGAIAAEVSSSGQYPNSFFDIPGKREQIADLAKFSNQAGVDFTTITIGGNDLGFAGIILECFASGGSCASVAAQYRILENVYDALAPVVTTLKDVKDSSGGAPVFILGYPDVISGDTDSCGTIDSGLIPLSMNRDERKFASEVLIPYVNHIVQTAAAQAGVNYVDVHDAFTDRDGVTHRICEDEPWANGFSAKPPFTTIGPIRTAVGTASFHPNALGQKALADAFMARVGRSAAVGSNPLADKNASATTPTAWLKPGQRPFQLVKVGITPTGGVAFDYAGQVKDRTLRITTDGLAPGSSVRYELHSDPVFLGSASADMSGVATLTVEVPSEVADGIHTVIADGTAADGSEAVGTVVVELVPGNYTPIASGDWARTTQSQSVELDLVANDADFGGDALSAVVVSQPNNGSLEPVQSGVVRYTPHPEFCGTDSFQYLATDGTLNSDTVTVAVDVDCGSGVTLVAADDTFTATTSTTAQIDVLANDTATDTTLDPSTLTITTPPTKGTAVVANGKISYTSAADARGLDKLSYRICDSNGVCDTADVSIDVIVPNGRPVASADTATTRKATPVQVAVLANDSDPDDNALTIRIGAQPSHGLAAADESQTAAVYTPDPDFCGSDTFTYTAFDGTDESESATVSVEVTCSTSPPVASDDTAETDEDQGILIDVISNDRDQDGDLDPNTVSVTQQPGHGTATVTERGDIMYTPNPDYSGPDSLTYKVCDTTQKCATATVAVSVKSVPDNPVAMDDAAVTDEDTLVDIPILSNDTDADGDPLTPSILQTPAHGTAVLREGELRYTPTSDWSGTDLLSYQVCDPAQSCATAKVTIEVRPANDAPVAAADSYSTARNTTLVVAAPGLLRNDLDVDGDPLIAQLVTQPANGSVTVSLDGSLSYTPHTDSCGLDTLAYIASDGRTESAPANITIEVRCPELPTAEDDVLVLDEDTESTADVLSNDSGDELDAASLTITAGPEHGAASVQGRSISYRPDLDYNGPDILTYRICDGAAQCAIAAVTIAVTPVNDRPTAGPDEAEGQQGHPVSIPVLGNDSDADGDTLTVGVVANPQHGRADVGPDQAITYTPAPDFCGTDSLTYRVGDGSAFSNAAVVTVRVACRNQPPSAVDDTFTTAEDQAGVIDVLANDSDDHGLSRDSLRIVSQPAIGVADVAAGSVLFQPAQDFNGQTALEYEVCDADALCARAKVTVTVTAVNDPPVCHDRTATGSVGVEIVVLPSCTDVDGDALKVVVVDSPTNATVKVLADGGISVTAKTSGTVAFSYAAKDGSSQSSPAVITLAVKPPPPSEPRRLTAVTAPFPGVGAGEVRLAWLPPANGGYRMSDYAIQWSTSRDTGWKEVNDGVSKLPTAKISGLENGTTHYFRVAAVTAAGRGSWSEVASAVPRTTPSIPKSLTTSARNRAVELNWTAPDLDGGSSIRDYLVQVSRDGRSWKTVWDGVSTGTSATVSGLTNGRKYSFRVAARNDAGLGPWTAVTTATPRK